MKITEKMLIQEIKTLQKAAKLHTKYSIRQYRKVLSTLEDLRNERDRLEEKVKERTVHLEKEVRQKENLAGRLAKVAKYDQLTGLANRYLFQQELHLVLEEAKLLGYNFALLFIDLDDFKYVNDMYGHDIGDELLQEIAERMKRGVRRSDMIARLGGDEFTIILKRVSERKKVSDIARHLIDSIREPVRLGDVTVRVGASVGIYLFNGEDDYRQILSKADIAMYEAKRLGKGEFLFFDEGMRRKLNEITRIKEAVKMAREHGEFVNFFQPIVESRDRKVRSAEVLLRWRHLGKMISPEAFMDVLEEDVALIKEVTRWQMEEVIALLRCTSIDFSVNLSAKLLNDETFVDFLETSLKKERYDPTRIAFEVTETTLSTNLSYVSTILRRIKRLGFHLSLDDFGTGYSSLAYVRELPFDTLKIDKKFVQHIRYSPKDRKLLQSIVEMAKILEMKIVLEGIETADQLVDLERGAFIRYQGYHFHRPMAWSRLQALLEGSEA